MTGLGQRGRAATADRVVVVGAGIIGATTAWRLAEAGFDVEIWSDRPTEQTTSTVAAAVWRPYRAAPELDVLRWGSRTLEVLEDLAADPQSGVLMREGIELGRSPMVEPPWHQDVRSFRHAHAAELPAGYVDGLAYTVPIVVMSVHLAWLLRGLASMGVQFRHQRVTSLREVVAEQGLVVNATGLGARHLASDESVYPVRGLVLRLSNPGLTGFLLDYHHPSGLTYVVPRVDDVIVGGTDQEWRWDTDEDEIEAAAILSRCLELVPELRAASVLGQAVGLRPGRPSVRVERELTGDGVIVHNYGHGGSGVTVAWGCAEEVTALMGAERGRSTRQLAVDTHRSAT